MEFSSTQLDEAELDKLHVVLEAWQQYADQKRCRQFALPKSDQDVADAMKSSIPQKTQTDTKYCITIFEKWRSHRQDIVLHSSIPPLYNIVENELNYWLPHFILEIRKKDCTEFPPTCTCTCNSLHHITCDIMRHLRWTTKPTIDFFQDPPQFH